MINRRSEDLVLKLLIVVLVVAIGACGDSQQNLPEKTEKSVQALPPPPLENKNQQNQLASKSVGVDKQKNGEVEKNGKVVTKSKKSLSKENLGSFKTFGLGAGAIMKAPQTAANGGMEEKSVEITEQPPVASVMAGPPADPMEAIDSILENLSFANIAFNIPGNMLIKQTAMINLILDMEKTAKELEDQLTATGSKESARIRVHNKMEARLTGTNFKIQAITPEEQFVSKSESTIWKWDITPLQEGTQALHLTLSALFTIEGNSGSKAIRTFDKEILIEVTWKDRLIGFFSRNWQWIIGTLIIPFGVWVWHSKLSKKKQGE